MKVYKILPDYRNFWAFSLPMKTLILNLGKEIPAKNLMHFYKHNISLGEKWQSINASFAPVEGVTQGNNIPDISTWVPGALVLSEKSKAEFSELNGSGEFLPVKTSNGPYWIFNCMTVVAADETQSNRVVEFDQVTDIKKLTFNPETVDGKHLFKTDYDGFRSLFCTDDFRRKILEMELQGLIFSDNLSGVFEQ
ncbi:imm11 family protein [Microbulbifer thermotolerans]|uniref:imm11 family protein n=1 Tax=Microbulbifer thermotolerans TaxID=252514 RepID=UPI0008E9620D|nr:DUF1629 domain-containing protein [Microbulbifer thermotolerans]MCX2796351.1 hypothetical protein [Microbulbifer thermotolerans]MCX2833061.1 hypothetical protein [Microbulbifer thermotolerans]SFC97655.1 hypothetical protein SAMN05660479_02862 [Microbulbifer thermotolerans]